MVIRVFGHSTMKKLDHKILAKVISTLETKPLTNVFPDPPVHISREENSSLVYTNFFTRTITKEI